MRIFSLYLSFLLFSSTVAAQMQFEPLSGNPVLKRAAAKIEKERLRTFVKLAGEAETDAGSRALDCDNIDGALLDGEVRSDVG